MKSIKTVIAVFGLFALAAFLCALMVGVRAAVHNVMVGDYKSAAINFVMVAVGALCIAIPLGRLAIEVEDHKAREQAITEQAIKELNNKAEN